MRQVSRSPGTGVTGAPQLPSSCPAPSPLEVGQLLLQQEHVGFELIPLLKDLLKLLSTEAALPYAGGTLCLLRGIRLREGGLVRGVPWLGPLCPWVITVILEGGWGGQGAPQQMTDQGSR